MKENRHKTADDIFSEQVRLKMENHPTLPDESVWQAIDTRLSQKKRAIPLGWKWVVAVTAAACIALFVGILNSPKQNEHLHTQTIRTATKLTDVAPQNHDSTEETAPAVVRRTHRITTTTAQTPTQQSHIDISTFQEEEATEGLADNDLPKEDSVPAQTQMPEVASLPEIPEILQSENALSSAHTEKGWSLAIHSGSYAGTNATAKSSLDKMFLPNELASDGYETNDPHLKFSNSPQEAQKLLGYYRHHPPVSFELRLQKDFPNRWGVSSGLIFTYMQSVYSGQTPTQTMNNKFQFYYAGIPLNVHYQWLQRRRWSGYLSAGGTLEKGMKGIFSQTIDGKTQKSSFHIRGWQTSVNAAVGFEYRFQTGWSLFAEPRVLYYWDNQQPLNARTQAPLKFGLNGGLKFSFQ